MNVEFITTNNGRRILQIDDARIVYRNFTGAATKFNRAGDRNFALVIDDREIADALIADVNADGMGWNVKVKPPREEGDEPFMFLPVKVKFNEYGPKVYLRTNSKMVRLDEESVRMLDDIDIEKVDLDIRPSDGEVQGKAYRTAYLQSICVTQRVDRFMDRYANEDEE